MFFNMVRKGSQRNRKENGLFFASQVIAIIAFYIIWSLENQDVMIFLQKMESDAVDKLFSLIPVLYGFSIVILFFWLILRENIRWRAEVTNSACI